MKVTIRSIAAAANVSRGTVDKVLNDRHGVSPEVRANVKRIAEEMGYQPNLAGKALAFNKNPIIIGAVILGTKDTFWIDILKGIKAAAREFKGFGLTVKYLLMENISVEEQIRCIRELQKENISALAISPLADQLVRHELNRLSNNNIKIVTLNTDICDVNRLCFIGPDTKRSGRVAGDLLGKFLPKGGNVLVVTGPERIKALSDRLEGFKEIICQEYPLLKIVNIIQNENNEDLSYSRTLEALKNRNDIDAIYTTTIGVGGIGKALHELNKTGIKLVSYDLYPETLELIKDKILDFAITQDPYTQGYLPIKILFEYLVYRKMPVSENIYTRLEIITKENLYI